MEIKTSSVAGRLETVKQTVADAARGAGRDPTEVTIVAVSKEIAAESVREAMSAGHLDFGENRAQEAAAKWEALSNPEIRWHFVGRLQRNKVKSISSFVHMIHSVDRLELAEEISRRATSDQQVLIEVNTSGEESKGGVPPAEVLGLVRDMLRLPRILVVGLMTMAPLVADSEQARPAFQLLASVRDQVEHRFPDAGIQHLSMGMSQDYVVAIEEGATIVRIGEAIFGPRRA